MNAKFNPETNQITDGTYTMKFDVYMMPAARFTVPTVKVDPLGEGTIAKVPAEKVPAIVERIISEVFPKFVAYRQAKESGDSDTVYAIFNEINNLFWSI